ALIGAGPARRARAEPADERLSVEFEEGAQAPAHGWPQDDGCAARTGASAARPLRGALEKAWAFRATEGTVEGEPLGWKDRVLVAPGAAPAGAASARYPRPSVRGGSVFVTSGRELVEVDRATGSERTRAPLAAEADPDTSRVVVTAGDVFVRRGAASAGAADT